MLAKGLARFWVWALIFVVLGFGGCSSSVRYSAEEESRYIKPTVAVESFENRAPDDMPWRIGDAMAEQLTERLVQTRRYEVLAHGPLRPTSVNAQRDSSSGPSQSADYVIRGVITDFGSTAGADGVLGVFEADSYSVVRAIIHVVDLNNNSVVASETLEARVPNSEEDQAGAYDQMAFGSYVFNRTSLGQAANDLLDDAVAMIAESIEQRPWQPKIASVMENCVVINGGSNRGVQRGTVYVVRSPSHRVYDPDQADPLGSIVAGTVGRVRVTQVTEQFAIAEVMSGSGFAPGQTLFVSDYSTSRQSVQSSSY
ncbi:MAG: hypothetical protein JW936_06700 [Sedimentisphaerales bacterium]|nr:hypothetical protein [Sedimentisphaerales bacterium]